MFSIIVTLCKLIARLFNKNASRQTEPARPAPVAAARPSRAAVVALMDRLEQLGFYRYVPAGQVAACKSKDVNASSPFTSESSRVYLADAEDLAEGGVQGFLMELRPFLHRLGVKITAVSQQFDAERDYVVSVNGTSHLIYSAQQAESWESWEQASRQAFTIVNRLLEQAGSAERLYRLYGGNDCQAVLLTPEMYAVIKESGLVDQGEMPESV